MVHAPIALLTDFGNQDPYVGIMKGVIERITPGAVTIDLSHAVPAGDIFRGAIVLWQSQTYFPEGTIFLAVVDPGVGTERGALLVRSTGRYFVGPDNGLFSFVLQDGWQAWALQNAQYRLELKAGNTFHGRDIFAPAAAHLAAGVGCADFGEPRSHFVRLSPPVCSEQSFVDGGWSVRGEGLYADHFGNLITSIGAFHRDLLHGDWCFRSWQAPGVERRFLASQARLKVTARQRELIVPLYPNFQEVPGGEIGGLIGSSGLLEIVANRDSAANMLQDLHCSVELIIKHTQEG